MQIEFRKLAATCLALCWIACASAQVDVERYVKPDTYERVKISPTGEFFALTMNLPDPQGPPVPPPPPPQPPP